MRRLEHPSGKFWSIELVANGLAIRWGENGTRGQGHGIHAFPPGLTPRAKSLALIARQLALGYVEIMDATAVIDSIVEGQRWFRRFEGGGTYVSLAVDRVQLHEWRGRIDEVSPPEATVVMKESHAAAKIVAAERIRAVIRDGMLAIDALEPLADAAEPIVIATNIQLEAECHAAGDHPEPFAIYADWLMTKNDPRGEIAALRARGKELEADALFARYRTALFDDGEAEDLADAIAITSWHRGFAKAAVVKPARGLALSRATTRFLTLPFAAFVDELQLDAPGFADELDWEPTMAAIASSQHAARIRVLRFDAARVAADDYGDFSSAWPHLLALEELKIRANEPGTLGTIVLPTLRKFVRVCDRLQATELASITRATWPVLEHLEIWFGRGVDGDVAQLRELFEAQRHPKLRHLGLFNSEFSEAAIRELGRSTLLGQLTSLDLSCGIIANREVDLLIANADQFKHLEMIDVSANYLRPSDVSRLRSVLPRVVANNQRTIDDADDDNPDADEDTRYAAIGE